MIYATVLCIWCLWHLQTTNILCQNDYHITSRTSSTGFNLIISFAERLDNIIEVWLMMTRPHKSVVQFGNKMRFLWKICTMVSRSFILINGSIITSWIYYCIWRFGHFIAQKMVLYFFIMSNYRKFKPNLENSDGPSSYSGNADFFVQNGVFVPFSYRFRILSFYAVSNAVWRKNGVETAFFLSANHKALIKTPFIV